MTRNLDTVFGTRDLRASPILAVQIVMAARISILYARAGKDPLPDMAVRLRSMRAAQALHTLLETVNRVWPEPFLAHRPCCMVMTPDETLVADVAMAAVRGSRDHARTATCDLLSGRSRDMLFNDMIELVDAIRAARLSEVDS